MIKAYLIVICHNRTNAVLGAEIWSSPEWEQSRRLPYRTFVAYVTSGKNFDSARKQLINTITDPQSRYNWLTEYMGYTKEQS